MFIEEATRYKKHCHGKNKELAEYIQSSFVNFTLKCSSCKHVKKPQAGKGGVKELALFLLQTLAKCDQGLHLPYRFWRLSAVGPRLAHPSGDGLRELT